MAGSQLLALGRIGCVFQLMRYFFEFGKGLLNRCIRIQYLLQDAFSPQFDDVLGEIAKTKPFLSVDLTLVRFQVSQENLKKGGLAGPIDPHQGDPFSGVDRQGNISQEVLPSVKFADVAKGDHFGEKTILDGGFLMLDKTRHLASNRYLISCLRY